MERKIGEIFECKGVKLEVKQDIQSNNRCSNCYFNFYDCNMVEETTGVCCSYDRRDGKDIIFVEVK